MTLGTLPSNAARHTNWHTSCNGHAHCAPLHYYIPIPLPRKTTLNQTRCLHFICRILHCSSLLQRCTAHHPLKRTRRLPVAHTMDAPTRSTPRARGSACRPHPPAPTAHRFVFNAPKSRVKPTPTTTFLLKHTPSTTNRLILEHERHFWSFVYTCDFEVMIDITCFFIVDITCLFIIVIKRQHE